MKIFKLVVWVVVITGTLYALDVWGLPWYIKNGTNLCSRFKLKSSFCGEENVKRAKDIYAWSQEHILPYAKNINPNNTLSDAYKGLNVLENAIKSKVGDSNVDEAIKKINSSLDKTQKTMESGSSNKIKDIPGNAKKLLSDVKTAIDELRKVFDTTQRRTEDVTNAVNNTKKALDALSSALPETKK